MPAHLLLRRIINRLVAVLLFAEGPDARDIERGNFRRAGDCVCSDCGASYSRHVRDPWDPWLHVLCDGWRVKL